jgi:hypothetical protein
MPQVPNRNEKRTPRLSVRIRPPNPSRRMEPLKGGRPRHRCGAPSEATSGGAKTGLIFFGRRDTHQCFNPPGGLACECGRASIDSWVSPSRPPEPRSPLAGLGVSSDFGRAVFNNPPDSFSSLKAFAGCRAACHFRDHRWPRLPARLFLTPRRHLLPGLVAPRRSGALTADRIISLTIAASVL